MLHHMNIASHPGFGFEITDMDLRDVSEDEVSDILKAFRESGLIFFRDQNLSEQDHIDLAGRFGTININRFFTKHPRYPNIAMVVKEPDQTHNIGGEWHTDHSYDLEPALGSILVARECPAAGGDTVFASMYQALDKLSDGLKKTLGGMHAVHSAKHVFGEPAQVLEDPVHPVIIRHPLSGKPALFINPQFTLRFDGWTEAESRPLMDYLFDTILTADDLCHFHWAPGSIAIWDNRATWHQADNDYHGQRRVMHRITIDGCGLEALGSYSQH